MQIDGPASKPYDVDLGPMLLTDYYHETADNLVLYTETNGPPPSDNVLFNGHAVNPSTGDGEYHTVTITPGKRHRLRLINTSKPHLFFPARKPRRDLTLCQVSIIISKSPSLVTI